MRTIYLCVEKDGILRKVAIDMAYFSTYKKIRLLKFYFEEGLYLKYLKDVKDPQSFDKYYFTKEKIIKEDSDFYYFKLPFKLNQVLDVSV